MAFVRSVLHRVASSFALAMFSFCLLAPAFSHAQGWGHIATISETTAGYLCAYDPDGEGDKNVDCNSLMPYISNTGYVGIGTDVPNRQLTILGSSGNTAVGVKDSSDSSEILLQVHSFYGGLVGTSTNHDFYLKTNNVNRMVVDRSGNVGISTTSPQTKLEVNGTISATDFVVNGVSIASGGGASALDDLTDATANYTTSYTIAIGEGALDELSLGLYNTAIGYEAGAGGTASTTASDNFTGVGYQAGKGNTGKFVTALGNAAAYTNQGDNLIAIGSSSAKDNTASNVIALGKDAVQNNTGSNLIAIGLASGMFNNGDDVLSLGVGAVGFNSGDRVIALGTGTAVGNMGNNLIAIGDGMGRSNFQSNQFIVGHSQASSVTLLQGNLATARLGVAGITDPQTSLEVSGTISATDFVVNGVSIASGGGASALDDLTDVSTGTPSANDVLAWNGSMWSTLSVSGCSAGSTDILPTFTAATTSGYVASASSNYSGTYPAWYAFDDNTGTFWHADASTYPSWLKVELAIATKVLAYSLTARSGTVGQAPKTWIFQGSNDDSTWTDLDSQTDVTSGWVNLVARSFTIASPGTYKYYRLYVSAGNDATYLSLGEMSLFKETCSGADDLGSHSAEEALVMNGYDIQSVGHISATTISATYFQGDGSLLTNLAGGPSLINGTSSITVANNGSITIDTAGATAMTVGSNGNVGIGTSTPANALTVAGDISATQLFTNTAFSADADMLHLSYGAGRYFKIQQPYADSASIPFTMAANHPLAFVTDAITMSSTLNVSNTLYVADDGSVGINNPTPSYTFDVVGSSRIIGDTRIGNTGGGYSLIMMDGGSAAAPSITPLNDSDTGIFGPAAGEIAFTNGGAESMRIDSSGHINIGTTTSTPAKLLVNGSVASIGGDGDFFTGPSRSFMDFATDVGRFGTLAGAGSGADLALYVNASEKVRILPSGNVGISTTNPQTKLEVNGTISATDLYVNGAQVVGGSSLWAQSGSNVYRASGNVGIGTSTPANALTVAGDISATTLIADNGLHGGENAATLVMSGGGSNSNGAHIVLMGGSHATLPSHMFIDADAHIFRAQAGTPEFMRITSSGFVGIGYASPSATLHIDGSTDAALTNGTGSFIIGAENDRNIAFDNNEIQARNNGASSTLWLQTDGGSLTLHGGLADSYQMVFNNEGNMGLGTSTPQTKLEVNGTISTTDLYVNGTQITGGAGPNLINGTSSITVANNGSITIDTAGARVMTVGSNGYVGIGTINPDEALHIRQDDGDYEGKIIAQATDQKLILGARWESGVEQYAFIDSENGAENNPQPLAFARNGGNVGIGTTTPQTKLEVNGTISTTALTVNGVAITGGSGPSLINGTSSITVANNSSITLGVANTNILTLSTDGRMGVRIPEPKRALHVGSDGILLENAVPISWVDAGGSPRTAMYINGSDILAIQNNTQGDGGDIVFNTQTGGVSSMRITSAGNIGIGTTTPSKDLEISGTAPTIQLTDGNGDATYANITIANDGGHFRIASYNSANTFVSNDYLINKNASGAAEHIWRIGNQEKMRINSAGNVGIGISGPSYPLHVSGTALFNDNVATTNVGVNGVLIRNNTAGDYLNIWNYAADTFAIESADSSTYRDLLLQPHGGNIGIGTADPSATLHIQSPDGAIGSGLRFQYGPTNRVAQYIDTNYDFSINYIDSTGIDLQIQPDGDVILAQAGKLGVNTTTPDEGKVEVKGGTVCVDTNSDDTASSCIASESDARLKKNIQPIHGALAKIGQLRGVSFDWRIDDAEVIKHYPLIQRFKTNPHSLGVIAQEVQPIVPEAIQEETIGDKDVQYMQVDYTKFTPLLIEAVKELKAENDTLKQQNADILKRLEALEAAQ